MAEGADKQRDIQDNQLKIDQLTHEMAVRWRLKFAASSEQVGVHPRRLFDQNVAATSRPSATN